MPHGDTEAALLSIARSFQGVAVSLIRLEGLLKDLKDQQAARQAELLERVDRLLLQAASLEHRRRSLLGRLLERRR